MSRLVLRVCLVTSVTGLILTGPVAAQFPPDSLENLKVLSSDMTPRQVINVMRGFALGLGVRCQYCHIGEEGQPLSELDFVSDDKEQKRTAREMLRMVMEINQTHLAGLENRGMPEVGVQCVTCHRGQARPIMTADAVTAAMADDGVEAGVAKYRELRERYYGSHTYDFSESVLLEVGSDLLRQDNFEGAITLGKLNLEFFPESGPTFTLLGQGYAELDQTEEAVAMLEKALEINPRNRVAQRTLRQVRGG